MDNTWLIHAGGNVIGCILTQRRHHIPNFIYRFFGSPPSYYYRYKRSRKAKRLAAKSGYARARPTEFDVLVVYEDRWQWDMSNYLIFLRIDLRDPSTNVLLATGSSYQTSGARKPEHEVVAQVIGGMFGDR